MNHILPATTDNAPDVRVSAPPPSCPGRPDYGRTPPRPCTRRRSVPCSAEPAAVPPGCGVEGVLEAGERFLRGVGVGGEVDVHVVRRTADPVRPDTEHLGDVAALVHQVRGVVELVGVPVARVVAYLVRDDVAEAPADEADLVAPRTQVGVERVRVRCRRAQQVEQHEGGVLVPVVARVDRGRDADGRDAGLGDGAADDHPADVGPAERVRIVTAVEDPDGEVRAWCPSWRGPWRCSPSPRPRRRR